MKKTILLLAIALFIANKAEKAFAKFPAPFYDNKYVEVAGYNYKGGLYYMMILKRAASGNRIKAKYFAAKDQNSGQTVSDRYASWSASKNIIYYASGAYSTDWDMNKGVPVGLTIDNGIIVNREIKSDAMDGLVIVQATGGIVATNLKDGNLTLDGAPRNYDLRGSIIDKNDFIKWSQDKQATVFQTHLLVYSNSFLVKPGTSSPNVQTRRFLAVGKNAKGEIIHVIVQTPSACTIYDGAKDTYDMLHVNLSMEIIWMINLDRGGKDVAMGFDNNGNPYNDLSGTTNINMSVNLISYYYE